ncbi:MAG: ribosome small subunit-dependent GTPase A [Calditrichaeota bacterium]|nr:MAG: ribosome small subunit-dependent GTPase A [Calditrichota bacterium]
MNFVVVQKCRDANVVIDLNALGWNSFFQSQWEKRNEEGLQAGRVSLQHKKRYKILTENGEFDAVIAGKLRHDSDSIADFPVVGDWVAAKLQVEEDKAVIHAVLPRHSKLSRDTSSRLARRKIADEQVMVANVDMIFLVAALNEELNLRRIERYLAMIGDSGAVPVVILNKADLQQEKEQIRRAIASALPGVDIILTSALTGEGVESLLVYFEKGRTIALMGSSGSGKSTLINAILGQEKQKVVGISRYKDRGRHTTTFREMILFERGGIIIDNPGMRSIQIWDGETNLVRSFEDIDILSKECRFSDCRHENEPGCAVQDAIANGTIASERYQNYLKLQKELAFRARRENRGTRDSSKKKWKQAAKSTRQKRQEG